MDNSHLWHGADYNPDQWLDHPEILRRDIELMKKAHVNMVSLGIFAWCTLEPSEGAYQLDWMQQTIDRLWAAGIHVDLATPSGARPAWMAQKYPEVLRMNADRVRQLYGERHNHCLTSPIYREKVRQINQMLARRFGRHPAVTLWHLSNEYGGACHCPLCQEAFRNWLKQRYGTLEALNKAWYTKFWSHEYTDFAQIESPAPQGEHGMHGQVLDWQRFVSDQTIDFMKCERDSIREIVPEAEVCVNMMYHFEDINYFDLAREIDIASWDSYPTWHKPTHTLEETAHDTAMMHDLYYSLKDKPFLMMESTPSMTNWQSVSKMKKPGMNIFSGLQAVAHGANGVLYFQWRQSRGASEKFHGAVVGHDGRSDNRVFVETAKLGGILEQLADAAKATRTKQAAIVYDWESHWAMNNAQGPRNADMGHYEELLRHYSALSRCGVDVQFVDERSELSGYGLVIAPMLYMLREGFEQKLRRFVQAGGTLVMTYWSGVVNESDLCFLGDTPHDLTDVLGLRRCEIDGMYDDEIRRCVAVDACMPQRAAGSVLCEVAALMGAKPLMVYDEDYFAGSPAVTVNEFGSGRAYYLATRFEPAFYDAFYGQLAHERFQTAWPEKLPVGVLAVQRGRYTFLQNAADTSAQVGDIALSPYETAVFENGVRRL